MYLAYVQDLSIALTPIKDGPPLDIVDGMTMGYCSSKVEFRYQHQLRLTSSLFIYQEKPMHNRLTNVY